jgi:hypothetical protein
VGFDNTIILWNTSAEAWTNHACRVAGRNLTQAEWDQYMPSGDAYHNICPEFP